MLICDVIAYCLQEEADQYPANMSKEKLGKYSTLDKAVSAIESLVTMEDPVNLACTTRIHSFSVAEIALDVGPKECGTRNIRIYDSRGILCGMDSSFADGPFAGRRASECRFQVGDFVEFISGRNKLEIVIIVHLPRSPGKVGQINDKYKSMIKKHLGMKMKADTTPYTVCDQSDNVYLIVFDGGDSTHDHLPECHLFKPRFAIPEVTRKHLQERLRLCHAT